MHELVDSFSNALTVEQGEHVETEQATESDLNTAGKNVDGTNILKQKKKKKKDKIQEFTEDINNNQTDVFIDDGQVMERDTDYKKKKQRKDKTQKFNEDMSPTMDLPNSDSSGYISDKSSKKRPAQDIEGLQDDIPVAKKKKKLK